MKKQSDRGKINIDQNFKRKTATAASSVVSLKGYFSLLVLSEKYGYAKDYIGWLSRTGRIEAVRHGKYGQWHASEESLKDYISSLASASEKRYSTRSTILSSITHEPVAELAVSGLPTDERGSVSSFPRTGEASTNPAEFSAPRVITAEPKTQPELPKREKNSSGTPVLFPAVPSNNEGKSSNAGETFEESSLSAERAEKRLAKRINAALAFSIALGGILIFLYLVPIGPVSFRNLVYSISHGIKSPIVYVWNKVFRNFPESIYITIIGGEKGDSGEPGKSGATVIREVRIVSGQLDPNKLNFVYDQINQLGTRIDNLDLKIRNLSSTTAGLPANAFNPFPQLAPSNPSQPFVVIINPESVTTKTLTVTQTAIVENLTVSTLSVAGSASFSSFSGAGLTD